MGAVIVTLICCTLAIIVVLSIIGSAIDRAEDRIANILLDIHDDI